MNALGIIHIARGYRKFLFRNYDLHLDKVWTGHSHQSLSQLSPFLPIFQLELLYLLPREIPKPACFFRARAARPGSTPPHISAIKSQGSCWQGTKHQSHPYSDLSGKFCSCPLGSFLLFYRSARWANEVRRSTKSLSMFLRPCQYHWGSVVVLMGYVTYGEDINQGWSNPTPHPEDNIAENSTVVAYKNQFPKSYWKILLTKTGIKKTFHNSPNI